MDKLGPGKSASRLPKPTPARRVMGSALRTPGRKSLGGVRRTSVVNSPKRAGDSVFARRDPTKPLSNSHIVGRATVASSRSIPGTRPLIGSNARNPNIRPLTSVNARVTGRAASPFGIKPKTPTDKEKLAELQKNMAAKEALIEAKDELLTAMTNSVAQCQTQLAQVQAETIQKDAQLTVKDVELQGLKNQIAQLHQKVLDLETLSENLREQVRGKDGKMRELHNLVVDLKGQIRVITRTRGLMPHENSETAVACRIEYPSRNSIKITVAGKETVGRVQTVFSHSANQMRVFEGLEDLILSTLHGYNVAVIAYGQTGAGKTYTMRGGSGEAAGVIPRSVEFLLRNMDELNDLGWKFQFSCSFIEIYNEEIYDLLAKDKPRMNALMQGERVIIPNITKRMISNQEEIDTVLSETDDLRATAATKCNAQSSRSHAVFSLYILAENLKTGQNTQSVLNLVDLAGSERLKETEAEGERFTEMKHINHGLTQLQMCIRAQQAKQTHIPYRSSKLTMVLSDSLGGGKSKTLVLVCINPTASAINENKRSIEFAQQLTKTNIGVASKQTKDV